jgi:hypothetical protein
VKDTGPENEVRWGRAYATALAVFAVEVALLYLFTIRFS